MGTTMQRWLRLVAIVGCLSLFLLTSLVAGAQSNPDVDSILIGFAPNVPEAARKATIKAVGGREVHWLAPIQVAEVKPAHEIPLADLFARVLPNDQVRFVEYNGVTATGPQFDKTFTVPDDPLIIPPNAIRPDDPALYDSQLVYAPAQIDVPRSWHYTMGMEEVQIAVLDTGLAKSHPEFKGKICGEYDFVNDDADASDDNGHGTHVAGIIAAIADNGEGLAGVCPRCCLMPIKVLGEVNSGRWFDVAEGILYAVDNGADVINLSLGGEQSVDTVKRAVAYALDHDVLVVAAAGNARSTEPFYPAAYAGVIGVSATEKDDSRWNLSNYGDYVDVAAPGAVIYSTHPDLNNSYGGYAFMSGTSTAAPHVAGLAALLLSENPTYTVEDLHQLIQENAVDLGASGRDPYFGHGRIDAWAALSAGASEPLAIAMLEGIIWVDMDQNGERYPPESKRFNQGTVAVRNAQGQLVASVPVDEEGNWRIGHLAAGTYAARLSVPADYQVTTQQEYQMSIEARDYRGSLGFGISARTQPSLFLPIVMTGTS